MFDSCEQTGVLTENGWLEVSLVYLWIIKQHNVWYKILVMQPSSRQGQHSMCKLGCHMTFLRKGLFFYLFVSISDIFVKDLLSLQSHKYNWNNLKSDIYIYILQIIIIKYTWPKKSLILNMHIPLTLFLITLISKE